METIKANNSEFKHSDETDLDSLKNLLSRLHNFFLDYPSKSEEESSQKKGLGQLYIHGSYYAVLAMSLAKAKTSKKYLSIKKYSDSIINQMRDTNIIIGRQFNIVLVLNKIIYDLNRKNSFKKYPDFEKLVSKLEQTILNIKLAMLSCDDVVIIQAQVDGLDNAPKSSGAENASYKEDVDIQNLILVKYAIEAIACCIDQLTKKTFPWACRKSSLETELTLHKLKIEFMTYFDDSDAYRQELEFSKNEIIKFQKIYLS